MGSDALGDERLRVPAAFRYAAVASLDKAFVGISGAGSGGFS